MRSVYLPVLLVLMLQACGHKGPLYLPESPQPNAAKPAAPVFVPSQEKQP